MRGLGLRWRVLRWLIVLIPALVLIIWLAMAQLPRWLAPQPGWFAADTPGVCAAVASLKLYQGVRTEPSNGIGADAARTQAEQIAAGYYDDTDVESAGTPLAVQVTLDDAAQALPAYLVTVRLNEPSGDSRLPLAAVIYLDAGTGEPLRLITATEDAAGCDFDVRAAVVAAVKSPPLILLVVYGVCAVGLMAARWVWKARRRLR